MRPRKEIEKQGKNHFFIVDSLKVEILLDIRALLLKIISNQVINNENYRRLY